MIGRIFLGLAISIAAVCASAAQEGKPSTTEEGAHLERPVYKYTEDPRLTFIHTLRDYCQKVLDALATNTPAEDPWIALEQESNDEARLCRTLLER